MLQALLFFDLAFSIFHFLNMFFSTTSHNRRLSNKILKESMLESIPGSKKEK